MTSNTWILERTEVTQRTYSARWARPLLLLLLIILVIANLYARDETRSGFVFELETGAGGLSINDGLVDPALVQRGWDFEVGIGVGIAPSANLLILLRDQVSMFSAARVRELYSNYFGWVSTMPVGLAVFVVLATLPYPVLVIPCSGSGSLIGPGVSWYASKAAPSFFIDATIGILPTYDPFAEKARGGVGARLGCGWELTSHFSAVVSAKAGYIPPIGGRTGSLGESMFLENGAIVVRWTAY